MKQKYGKLKQLKSIIENAYASGQIEDDEYIARMEQLQEEFLEIMKHAEEIIAKESKASYSRFLMPFYSFFN